MWTTIWYRFNMSSSRSYISDTLRHIFLAFPSRHPTVGKLFRRAVLCHTELLVSMHNEYWQYESLSLRDQSAPSSMSIENRSSATMSNLGNLGGLRLKLELLQLLVRLGKPHFSAAVHCISKLLLRSFLHIFITHSLRSTSQTDLFGLFFLLLPYYLCLLVIVENEET